MPVKKNKFTARTYQKRCIKFLKENNKAAIILPPGAGKTYPTLYWINYLITKKFIKHFLLIAPMRPIYDTWEITPAEHFPRLKVCNIHQNGFIPDHHLYTINPERFVIDIKENKRYLRQFSGQGFGVDESTLFKNCLSNQRGKENRTQLFHRFIDVIRPEFSCILTGTDITKSLLEYYGQYYLIDKSALGPNFFIYRSRFFEPTADGRSWVLKEGMKEEILRRIAPKTFMLTDKEEKEIGYPKVLESDIYFRLKGPTWRKYKKLHDELIVELDDRLIDRTIHKNKLYTGAVNYGYCTQFTSGFFYEPILKEIPDPKKEGKTKTRRAGHKINFIHNERMEVLKELIDTLDGDPLFCLYHFNGDVELFKKLKLKGVEIIKGGLKPSVEKEIRARWNAGKIKILFAQISAVAHGLNLQFGGSNVCFYNVPDNYELYKQALHRIVRPGQKKKRVHIYRIIARYTVDEINRLQILNKKIILADEVRRLMKKFTKQAQGLK